MVTKSSTLAQILACMDENRIKVALEANFQQRMVIEANTVETNKTYNIGDNPIFIWPEA